MSNDSMLPQKKRALVATPGTNSTNNSSSGEGKKFAKVNNNNSSEDCVDDETLIRETEAALKNLSGSWLGAKNNNTYYSNTKNSERAHPYETNPAFENLFDENKNNYNSTSRGYTSSYPNSVTSSVTSSHELSSRDAGHESAEKRKLKRNFEKENNNNNNSNKDIDNLLKIENECTKLNNKEKVTESR